MQIKYSRYTHRNTSFIFIFALLITNFSCEEEKPPDRNTDPFNKINTARIDSAKVIEYKSMDIPDDAFSDEPFDEKKTDEDTLVQPPEKIHPLLKQWLTERPGNEIDTILINFRDDLTIPRFPEPEVGEPRDSETNKRALARAEELIRDIKRSREQNYQKLFDELNSQYQCDSLETFWLINGMVVVIPLNAVGAIAERLDVFYMEPQNSGEKPPQDGNPNNDVDDGRRRIVSDPYFNLGLTRGWIGLLDTGVRFTHTQFTRPSNIAFRFDCVNGGANCNSGAGFNPNDDCWDHGTSSAAIVSANANQGNPYRGVTGITLDSFKVYPNGCGGLSSTAAVRGFQRAIAVLDRVIIAEMQGGGNDRSAISTAADNAFDAGAVIIAANGNNGPGDDTVNSPANAHKVIGVGNFDVQTLNQINSQSRGAAPDNRFKPDIQAPTNTETASSASNTALKIAFTGTSGATPYASGAAALLRNWLRNTSFSIDPGQVYAQLILSGQQPYPFNNTSGAGRLQLPTNGWAWWGKVSVTGGMTINIPINISSGTANTFDGALWWPETAAQNHNDIDLYLIDPNGNMRDFSFSIPSVFERARVPGPIVTGTWILRIRGFRVFTGAQTVYWAAHVRLR